MPRARGALVVADSVSPGLHPSGAATKIFRAAGDGPAPDEMLPPWPRDAPTPKVDGDQPLELVSLVSPIQRYTAQVSKKFVNRD